MNQISAFSPTKRDPQRVMIRVDGKVVATLYRKLLEGLDLHIGQEWTPALEARVEQEAAYDKALRAAMNRLNRRMMSRRDLARKLKDLEHDTAVVQRVCDRLEELELLNDAAYGAALIRSTNARKPAGPALLRAKLMQKGLDRQLIDKLLSDHAGDTNEQVAQARQLIESKLRSMQRLEPQVRQRRLWGMLARRGYNSDVIRDAMDVVEE